MSTFQLEESLVLGELYTHQEVQHTRREKDKERSRLTRKFTAWESSMREHFFKKRALPKHWLPQTDRHSGRTYYFNLKTGASSPLHPLHAPVEELRKREQAKAEELLNERLAVLQQYEQRLQSDLEQRRAALLNQLVDAHLKRRA